MGCCSCGAAMLNIPPLASSAPPPQPINGALQSPDAVGIDIPQVAASSLSTSHEGEAMSDCGCDDAANKWWLWLAIGLLIGHIFTKSK